MWPSVAAQCVCVHVHDCVLCSSCVLSSVRDCMIYYRSHYHGNGHSTLCFLKLADFLLYFTRDLKHLDTGCLIPWIPAAEQNCSCDNNCSAITYDRMQRSPGLLVSLLNRVQQ